MSNLEKIIQKFLLGKPFFKDGFEYQFIQVNLDKKGESYNIIVNVVLPKKNQSYFCEIFSREIKNILNNIWKYIGTSFSYSEEILVDGQIPEKGGLFISDEKQIEVLNAMREQVKKITLKTAIGLLSYNVYWRPSVGKFYRLDDSYIDFYFYIKISNFTLNGKSVNPNLNMIDEIAGVISDMMYYSDSVKTKIDDILYIVMENEMKIGNLDNFYLQGMWHISHIDGMEVHPTISHFNLAPEMFT